ncbi:MAG: hypothetical protein C0609_03970 [Deltaproteobacteria bacterium]|nr:MAG: hypothetical protein C0609_03970 [Deltaproteobacteria bacterium]
MKISRAPALKTALCLLSLLAFLPALAAPIGDQLSTSVELSQTERASLEPMLAHYYGMRGDKGVLSKVIDNCAGCGCREGCLSDVVDYLLKRMQGGKSNNEAGEEILSALNAAKGYCKNKGIDPAEAELSRAVASYLDALDKREGSAAPSPMVR